MTPGAEVSEHATTQGTLALLVVGVIAAVLGAAWWAFDADPMHGKVILVFGIAGVIASRVLRGRLTPFGERALLVIVAVLVLLSVLDAVHLVQVVSYQRASHNFQRSSHLVCEGPVPRHPATRRADSCPSRDVWGIARGRART